MIKHIMPDMCVPHPNTEAVEIGEAYLLYEIEFVQVPTTANTVVMQTVWFSPVIDGRNRWPVLGGAIIQTGADVRLLSLEVIAELARSAHQQVLDEIAWINRMKEAIHAASERIGLVPPADRGGLEYVAWAREILGQAGLLHRGTPDTEPPDPGCGSEDARVH